MPTPPSDVHVKNIRLPRDLHDDIVELAERNERSGEAEIRVALRDHVRRERRRLQAAA